MSMVFLKQKKFLLSLIFVVFLIVPQLSLARGIVPCGGPSENPCKFTDIFVLVARATNYLIGAAGIYAVFQIVNSGFWLILSNGDEEKIKQWKTALTNSIVGFVLVMVAFLLINTAANLIFSTKCKVDLLQPLSYLDCK